MQVGNLTHLFAQLPGLSEVANQDAVGKYSLYVRGAKRTIYNLSCADTVYYQAVLTEAAEAAAAADVTIAGRGQRERAEITVNMELFSRRDTVPQSTIVGDPMEHAQRRCCYDAHNLTIGPSWEITDILGSFVDITI